MGYRRGRDAVDWGGWTRTTNFPVNSRTVCQLTYTPRNAVKLKPTAHFLYGQFATHCTSRRRIQETRLAWHQPDGLDSRARPGHRRVEAGPGSTQHLGADRALRLLEVHGHPKADWCQARVISVPGFELLHPGRRDGGRSQARRPPASAISPGPD